MLRNILPKITYKIIKAPDQYFNTYYLIYLLLYYINLIFHRVVGIHPGYIYPCYRREIWLISEVMILFLE